MSILQFTPQNTTPVSHNKSKFLEQIKNELNNSNHRRWWMVTRTNSKLKEQQIDMLFFRDLEDIFTNCNPKDDRYKMLIPLYQYLKVCGIDPEHSDALIEGYFSDNLQCLDVHYHPNTAASVIHYNPDKTNFATDELSLESFCTSDLVPIHMVNKPNALENRLPDEAVHADLYIQFEHTDFIEMVFRSYSIFVKNNVFAIHGIKEAWDNYLTLMQENVLAENLEEIHKAYWYSHCQDLDNLTNSNSIN